jgi:tRNA pseudouridine32 synthase/23S rRNA pseudouridine746 synthase
MPISLAETEYTAHPEEQGRAKQCPEKNFPLSTFHFPLTPPCDERCGILLPAMLGLRILYRDDAICVVNKQSGLLSVPGRGEDKQDCIESRFRRLFGDKVEIKQPAVHRLDMETSGIMILVFTKEAHRELNRQFEAKEVQKEYVALLDGVLPKMGIAPHGTMELFFRLDVDNRPHQIWDAENGKSAVTEWQILGVERYHAPDGTTRNVTRVLFMPHTGRTHQLRLASSDSHGFGCPIIGDTLYGHCDEGERLMLHAKKISFTHPLTGERMIFECEPEF